MKLLPTLFLVFLWPFLSWSQVNPNGQVHGRILDADTRLPLSGASVSLIVAKDSSKTDYITLSDDKGIFSFPNVMDGSYLAFISFLGYNSKLHPVLLVIQANSIDIEDIRLKQNTLILKEIEVKGKAIQLKVKKDTLEYNAAYFRVEETELMNTLLRKIPGVQITPDGKISVNGKIVEYILIDGKPFYGADTKQASLALLSGVIDKVQLIDRIPERMAIEDPTYSKTEKVINIVLKDDQHNKINGLAIAAYGPGDKILTRTNLNRFEKRRQISLVAGGNNVNDIDGFTNFNSGPLKLGKAGFNYNQDFSSNASLNLSYQFNKINAESISISNRVIIFTDSINNLQQTSKSIDKINVHSIDLNFKYNIDSTSALSIASTLNVRGKNNIFSSSYNTMNDNAELINGGSLVNNTNSGSVFNLSSINYSKAFRRIGKVFKIGFENSFNRIDDEVLNSAQTTYNLASGIEMMEQQDQFVKKGNTTNNLKITLLFTQPLSKVSSLDFLYNYNRSFDKLHRKTFDFNPDSKKFDLLLDSLSGSIDNVVASNSGKLNYRMTAGKFQILVGGSSTFYKQQGRILKDQQVYEKTIFALSPSIVVDYNLKIYQNFHFDYGQRLNLPNISLIFPIPDNSNPLLIQSGNLELRPTRTNSMNLYYSANNPNKIRSFSVNVSFNFASDQIINTMDYDSLGRQLLFPVNVDGSYFGNVGFFNTFRVLKNKVTIGSYSALNLSKDQGLLNKIPTGTYKRVITQSFRVDYIWKKFMELNSTIGIVVNNVEFKPQPMSNQIYVDYLTKTELKFNLPASFQVKSELIYNAYKGRGRGVDIQQVLLNASITKSLLKKKLDLKFQSFDLLNNNANTVRNTGIGYIEDVRTNTINRFYLFALTYYLL